MKAKVTDELKQHFRPEFLNRVDEIIVFPPLTQDEIISMVDYMIDAVELRLKDRDMALELTQAAKELLATRGFDPVLGARPLRRTVQRDIEDVLAEKMLYGEVGPGQIVLVDVEGEGTEQRVHLPRDAEAELPDARRSKRLLPPSPRVGPSLSPWCLPRYRANWPGTEAIPLRRGAAALVEVSPVPRARGGRAGRRDEDDQPVVQQGRERPVALHGVVPDRRDRRRVDGVVAVAQHGQDAPSHLAVGAGVRLPLARRTVVRREAPPATRTGRRPAGRAARRAGLQTRAPSSITATLQVAAVSSSSGSTSRAEASLGRGHGCGRELDTAEQPRVHPPHVGVEHDRAPAVGEGGSRWRCSRRRPAAT